MRATAITRSRGAPACAICQAPIAAGLAWAVPGERLVVSYGVDDRDPRIDWAVAQIPGKKTALKVSIVHRDQFDRVNTSREEHDQAQKNRDR